MKVSRAAAVLVFLVAALCPSWSDCAELVRHPESQTQFSGTVSTFYCQGNNFSDVDWLVNGASALKDKDRTGIDKRENISDDTISLELLVPGIEINNGSRIRCYGLRLLASGTSYNQSNPAVLLLQGPPDKIVNFKGTNTSDTTILLSWEPPYHLPGTTCCSQYFVNVTHVDGTVIMDDNITMENMSFTVDRERLCDTYIVTIVAYNPAGEGEVFLTQWSLAGFFELDSVTHDLYYENTNLLLDADVTIGGYCLNQVDNVTLSTACPRSPGSGTSTTNPISAPPTVFSFTTDFEVPLPVEDEICYYEVALENNFAGLRQDISTFDVSSASIVSTPPGEVCLSCQYLRNSLARGCEIEVNNNEFDSDRYRGVLLRDEAQVCIPVQYGGSFTVNIYDINDDNRRSAGPAVVFSDVVIDDPPPSDIDTVMSTTVFTDTGAFAGVLVAVVLVVVIVCVSVAVIVIVSYIIYKRSVATKHDSGGVEEVDCPLTQQDRIAFDGGRPVRVTVGGRSVEITEWFESIRDGNNTGPFNVMYEMRDGTELNLNITVVS